MNISDCSFVLIFRFNDEPGSEKKILPQYDDPVTDEVKLFVVIGGTYGLVVYCRFLYQPFN